MAPKYNPVTKKFEFPKDEKVASTSDMAYVAIPKTTMAVLVKFAKQDGAPTTGGTEKGTQNAESKAARVYILQSIQDFIDARGKASK